MEFDDYRRNFLRFHLFRPPPLPFCDKSFGDGDEMGTHVISVLRTIQKNQQLTRVGLVQSETYLTMTLQDLDSMLGFGVVVVHVLFIGHHGRWVSTEINKYSFAILAISEDYQQGRALIEVPLHDGLEKRRHHRGLDGLWRKLFIFFDPPAHRSFPGTPFFLLYNVRSSPRPDQSLQRGHRDVWVFLETVVFPNHQCPVPL